jgi:hypothetical protein
MEREGDGIVYMDEEFSQILKREMTGKGVGFYSPADDNRCRGIEES